MLVAARARYFLYDADGDLRFVPRRVIEGLFMGKDRLPQLAGQKVRAALAVVENEGGRPSYLAAVRGVYWLFDANGRIQDARPNPSAPDWMDLGQLMAGGPNVVIFKATRRASQVSDDRWEPTSREITEIVYAIWPETAGRPVVRPRPIRGVLQRKPPMTLEAKQAIRECWSPLYTIRRQIGGLKEPSLKAFIAEMAEGDPVDMVDDALRKAVATAATKQLEIIRAWKSDKGRWYAVAELTTNDEDGVGHVSPLEHIECKGRQAAIAAGRELIRKYADQFSDTATVEVSIHPEAEWEPERTI